MLSTHAKLAFRQLKRNKVFTFLNILGLTLGLTTFLLITLYVADELSYDRFNMKAGRIVRLNTDLKLNGAFTAFADATPPVAGTLRAHYPEVEATVRICPVAGARFRNGNEELPEPNIALCDPGIFDIFTLPMIEGDPHTALQDPHAVVITESTARRYFNTTRVVGRTLARIDEPTIKTITGVIRDLPAQSHFHYDFLLSMHSSGLDVNNSYYALYPMSTYVLLKPDADRKAFDKKLAAFMRTWDKDYAEYEKGGMFMQLGATPLTDIHLRSHRTDELSANGNIQYIYIFSAIALFVLLIAGINFMNLSTARSANRAREVGVRKVLGSPRWQLIAQFLTESLALTAIATIMAFFLTWIALPWFNQLTGKEFTFSTDVLSWLLPSLLVIMIVVGLFSGAYPAFFLSAFRPMQVLKSKLALGGRGSRLRSTLVVLQFSISICLIVGTLVVLRQLHYIQHRDPGYDRNQVLVIKGMDGLTNSGTLKKEIQGLTGVANATLSDFLPTNTNRWHNFGTLDGSGQNAMQTELWVVDKDYISTMGMYMIKGRNFSADMPTDTTAIVINEAAVRMFGIPGDPLNKTIYYPHYFHPTHFHIIGVVKDFNFTSIRTSVAPLVLVNRAGDVQAGLSNLDIRVTPGHVPDVLAQVKAKWAAFAPQRPFDYSFMDEDFDAIYRAEQRMGQVVVVLTTLAIIIACLGLFGLATYAAEQRSKEIGIRKVLGADIPSIVALLSKDFARLIILAILIASPLAWYCLHQWLQNFAYRTTIDAWIFAIAAAIVLLVALVTTLIQSLKAAVVNPIGSLRSE
jgi:putative ABC transport system permease protein